MKPSLVTKLTQLSARLEELSGLLAAPDVTRDLDRYRALSREHAEIAPVVALHRDWQQAERDLANAQELVADQEMKAYAEEEAKSAKTAMERLEDPLLERAIGVIYLPKSERTSHYFYASLPRQFDAVLHYDVTRAVEPLEKWELDHTREMPETYPSTL